MDRDILMPNQHKTKSVNWHPSDPTLRPWLEAEAEGRRRTLREILDEALSEYRQRRAALTEEKRQ
jgi:hypothetical protein